MDKALRNLFRALAYIREKTENPELQVVSAQILLEIAQRAETPMVDLEKATDLSQAAVSRNVAKLGQGLSLKEPGPGLVEAYEDPEYRRRKLVRLSPRGKQVMQELSTLLDGAK